MWKMSTLLVFVQGKENRNNCACSVPIRFEGGVCDGKAKKRFSHRSFDSHHITPHRRAQRRSTGWWAAAASKTARRLVSLDCTHVKANLPNPQHTHTHMICSCIFSFTFVYFDEFTNVKVKFTTHTHSCIFVSIHKTLCRELRWESFS